MPCPRNCHTAWHSTLAHHNLTLFSVQRLTGLLPLNPPLHACFEYSLANDDPLPQKARGEWSGDTAIPNHAVFYPSSCSGKFKGHGNLLACSAQSSSKDEPAGVTKGQPWSCEFIPERLDLQLPCPNHYRKLIAFQKNL